MPKRTPAPNPVTEPLDDGPLIDHDTFRQIVFDLTMGRLAVNTLLNLLQDANYGSADGGSGTGLAVLLEGAEQRMALALDGLRGVAGTLGVADALFMEPMPAGAAL